MENDLKLWEKIQNGDTQALKLLHDRYYYPLYFYARKLHHNKEGLEEVVADCFIKLWIKRNDLVISSSVNSYLFLMVRNGLIDSMRKKGKTILLEFGSIPELPDEQTQHELDQFDQLYKALEKLPEQRRRILELAVYESRTYAQISEKLGISVNTVKTQIGRAYRFLKEELDPKCIQLMFMLRTSD